jgi:hypothetical protein
VKKRTRITPANMFTRKLVITIPRSGAVVIALAICVTLVPAALQTLIILVNASVTIVALAACMEARYQLRRFRFEIRERLVEAPEFEEEKELAPSNVVRLSK